MKIARKALTYNNSRNGPAAPCHKIVPMTPDKWANPKAMWDERFSQVDPVYGDAPNSFLRKQASRLTPGMKVLVPADGYGRNGIWLAKQGFHVHTVDLSPVGVERARKAAAAAGVHITQDVADLSTWNWPVATYDAVISIFFHMPSAVRPTVHGAMLRALKPGGIIIVQAFTPAQLNYTSGGPKQVDLLFNADILQQDFAGAAVIQVEEKLVDLTEGHMHSGPAAVVQAIFRRP
jgi:2-polyprenyl-3-methyl-5-hydroxy-6-metoxy-1,4-benzoquinol methylase